MILSFSQLGKFGRLGNQLFQITSTLGLAEKYGAKAAFPDWEYEEYFDTPIPHGPMQSIRIREKHFHYHDWALKGDTDILGYLQSEKYFGTWRPKLKEDLVEAQKAKFPKLFEKETICIHIRRGDFIGNDQYAHLPITYYIHALLHHFPRWKDYNILFLSDDIEYVRTHFDCLPNAFFSSGLSDIEDMALGSACDHFIICNSTFGWWVAWLGEKEGTKVVRPVQQFAGQLAAKNNVTDYSPDRWIAYDRSDWRIPLRDMTFTIPVFFDHDDRQKNLDLSLCMLQQAFDTNFIVCEQGGDNFKYIEKFATYSRMSLPNFHRTRMLNWMAEIAETPFVANWDADVIIPPMAIYLAVEKLREGADMVYPYGGQFARMPRDPWFKEIEKMLDIGVVGATEFQNRVEGHMSVGGAVFFNREAFLDGGGENENMIAYGPEDFEREYRFRMLGYDVQRVGGTLFHLNHFVGVNSSKGKNPYYAQNWAEWQRVQVMLAPELRKYVDSWPWRHQYTSHYYHRIQEGAVRSASIVMAALPFKPRTVVDIGCGLGEWSNGNPHYYGLDYGVKRRDLLFPEDHYVNYDLNKEFPPVLEKYDLALCLEVAEHLNPDRAELLVEFLCSLSDKVLFSAAIPNQGGQGHLNEQWQTYWGELFKKHGFGRCPDEPDFRDLEGVELWYRQNMVLYERGCIVKVEDFVLPEYYVQITQNLHNRLKDLGR